MKIGPLQVEIHGEPLPPATPDHGQAYYVESLRELSRILNEVPWMLAGGLAVPFTLGRFFREHGDIDIMVPLTSMPSACAQLHSAGYRLYRRITASHNSRKLVVRYPVQNVTRITPSLNCSMLRVKGSQTHRILNKIDIHPFEVRDGLLLSDYRGPALEVSDPIPSHFIETGHESGFRCLDLHYIAQLKQVRQGVKHQIDLVAIERGVDRAMVMMHQHCTP